MRAGECTRYSQAVSTLRGASHPSYTRWVSHGRYEAETSTYRSLSRTEDRTPEIPYCGDTGSGADRARRSSTMAETHPRYTTTTAYDRPRATTRYSIWCTRCTSIQSDSIWETLSRYIRTQTPIRTHDEAYESGDTSLDSKTQTMNHMNRSDGTSHDNSDTFFYQIFCREWLW